MTIEVIYEGNNVPDWLDWNQSYIWGEFPASARGIREFILIAADNYGAKSDLVFYVNVLNNPLELIGEVEN